MDAPETVVPKVEEKPVEVVTVKEGEEKPVNVKKEEPPKENHDTRRWRRLLKENAENKARADFYENIAKEKQSAPQEPTKPTLAQFEGDVEKYTDALTDYKIAIANKGREHSAPKDDSSKGWKAKEVEAKKSYADYDEVVYEADPLTLPEGVINAIATSDFGPDIRYLLAKEPELADKIENLTEAAAIREIGKLESRIETARKDKLEKKPVEKKKLPAPIEPENGGSGPETDMSAATLYKKFSQREKIST